MKQMKLFLSIGIAAAIAGSASAGTTILRETEFSIADWGWQAIVDSGDFLSIGQMTSGGNPGAAWGVHTLGSQFMLLNGRALLLQTIDPAEVGAIQSVEFQFDYKADAHSFEIRPYIYDDLIDFTLGGWWSDTLVDSGGSHEWTTVSSGRLTEDDFSGANFGTDAGPLYFGLHFSAEGSAWPGPGLGTEELFLAFDNWSVTIQHVPGASGCLCLVVLLGGRRKRLA